MTHRPPPHKAHDDSGSVAPLVIGMMLCLLILGAGVTAAGSAFLAGQSLQHVCDGAAAAAAGTVTDNSTEHAVTDTAHDYLAIRSPGTTATVVQEGTTLTVTCDADTPITFGALFATPTLHRTVTATAKTTYRTG